MAAGGYVDDMYPRRAQPPEEPVPTHVRGVPLEGMSDEDVPIPLRWGGTNWLEPLMVSAGYGLDKLIELGRKGYTRLRT